MKKQVEVRADLLEEVSNKKLEITGSIPSWLSGTLVRNGPISVEVGGKKTAHWFDGLAMLHAFSFQNGAVHYTNKFLRTDGYRTVFEEGKLNYDETLAAPSLNGFLAYLSPLPS